MKNLRGLSLVLIMIIGVAYSCDKEDPISELPAVPTISITPGGTLTLSADAIEVVLTKDSTIIAGYAIAAEGKIKELKQTVDGVLTTVSSAVGLAAYTKQLIIPVTYEDYSIELKLEVMDESDQVATKIISIDVKAIIPPEVALTEVQENTMGGNWSYARWDLEVTPIKYFSGCMTNGDDKEADRLAIDIIYEFGVGDVVGDEKLQNFETTYTEWVLAAGTSTGAKFATTDFTAAEFDAMIDDSSFKLMAIDKDEVPFLEGDVVLVVLPSGLKFVILVGSSDGADTNFSYKKQVL